MKTLNVLDDIIMGMKIAVKEANHDINKPCTWAQVWQDSHHVLQILNQYEKEIKENEYKDFIIFAIDTIIKENGRLADYYPEFLRQLEYNLLD